MSNCSWLKILAIITTLLVVGYFVHIDFKRATPSIIKPSIDADETQLLDGNTPVFRANMADAKLWLNTTILFTPTRRVFRKPNGSTKEILHTMVNTSNGAVEFFQTSSGGIWRVRYLNGQVDLCAGAESTVAAAAEVAWVFTASRLSVKDRDRIRKAASVEGYDELRLPGGVMKVSGSCMDVFTITAIRDVK